jgi:drug/metabolite transporter (DMT)-like permease
VLKRLPGLAPPLLTGARYVFGGVVLFFYWALRAGPATLPPLDVLVPLLPVLVLQGLITFYVGTMLWYGAITRLDLARTAAIVVPSIPILSLGASFLLLGEIASLATRDRRAGDRPRASTPRSGSRSRRGSPHRLPPKAASR